MEKMTYQVPHFLLHSFLDGVLQTLSISWISTITQYKDFEIDIYRPIPIKLGALTVKRVPRDKMYVYGRLLESSIEHAVLNILLLSENGEVIATIVSFVQHVTDFIIRFNRKPFGYI
jgi:hypothetical protein